MLTQQTAAAILLERYRTVRSETMRFCSPLTPEDLMVQSCPRPRRSSGTSPTPPGSSRPSSSRVRRRLPALPPRLPLALQQLLQLARRDAGEEAPRLFSRPPLDQILAYRTHVDAAIARCSSSMPEDEALRRIALGLEHEQQHQELIATDIKHASSPTRSTRPIWPPNPPRNSEAIARRSTGSASPPATPASRHRDRHHPRPTPQRHRQPSPSTTRPRATRLLAPFRLASRLVTCAEYLAFIDENGYTRPELWLSEGWDTMRAEGWQAPLYWQRDAPPTPAGASTPCTASSRSTSSPRPPSATSASSRPTPSPAGPAIASPPSSSGSSPPRSSRLPAICSSTRQPAPLTPRRPHATTPQQIFGDVWEWTQSPYTGYPGYKPAARRAGRVQRQVHELADRPPRRLLRHAAEPTSAPPIATSSFLPGTRWQFSGLRLAGMSFATAAAASISEHCRE
jgi:formylglycine-generating enzyme required for sulfatase activity